MIRGVYPKRKPPLVPRYNACMALSSTRFLIFLLASSWFTPSICASQQPRPPRDAIPASTPALIPGPQSPPPHAFWDQTNFLLFSGVGVLRGIDYASTRNFQARGREEVLIPDDVVNNSAGFASLEAAGTAAAVGLSYWMHRVGHHKIERWISIVHIGVTGFGVVRNYSLKSKHRAP